MLTACKMEMQSLVIKFIRRLQDSPIFQGKDGSSFELRTEQDGHEIWIKGCWEEECKEEKKGTPELVMQLLILVLFGWLSEGVRAAMITTDRTRRGNKVCVVGFNSSFKLKWQREKQTRKLIHMHGLAFLIYKCAATDLSPVIPMSWYTKKKKAPLLFFFFKNC